MSVIDETWAWRQILTEHTPPSRELFSMVSADDRIILFGGFSDENPGPGTSRLQDVWEFYADDWHEVPISGDWPSARSNHIGCWCDDKMLIAGGRTGLPDDTWTYEPGVGWTEITTATGFPSWGGYTTSRIADWDDVNQRVLMLTQTGDTWQFTFGAGDWSQIHPSPEFASAVGGLITDIEDGSSCWAGDRWITLQGFGTGAAGGSYNEIKELLVDPSDSWTCPYTATAINQQTPAFGTITNNIARGAAWTGDRMFTYGGNYFAHAGTPQETQDRQFNIGKAGTDIEELTFDNTPSARLGHCLVWDGTRIVMFGGIAGTGGDILHETWALEPPNRFSIRATFGLGE